MSGVSIPPSAPPVATVTVESNEIHVTAAFRDYENALDHERAEGNAEH